MHSENVMSSEFENNYKSSLKFSPIRFVTNHKNFTKFKKGYTITQLQEVAKG